MQCSAVLTNLLGDVFLSFLPHLSLEEGIEKLRVTSAKGSQKSEYNYMLAFDWLEQTDKIGYNIFPVRMTCNMCRAMLPNYLRTYSSALCQIRALEKTFKKQNNGQSVPKNWVLNACIRLARTNTQNLQQYSTYFACNNDLRSAVLTNLLGDIFLSFLPHLSLEEGINI